jgi:hypothetical protein
VPSSDVAQFVSDIAGGYGNRRDISVRHIEATGGWLVDVNENFLRQRLNSKFGTDRAPFSRLLNAALNDTPLRFYIGTGADRMFDQQATDLAAQQTDRLRQEFHSWLWKDPDRRTRLHRYYNDNFNNIVLPKFNADHYKNPDGTYTLPGMAPGESLRDHQARAVWRIVSQGRALLAHEVGTGKTYTMVAAAMELRRLGLAQKPVIAMPKPVIGGFTRIARKLYPGARIISTSGRFDKKNRTETIAQIATGNWDIVIMTHDNLNMLKMNPETIERFINEEILALETVMHEVQESEGKTDKRFIKKLEKRKENLRAKLEEAIKDSKKDDAVMVEETGVDFLFVDESHYYKNAPVYSAVQNLKGVPTSESDRAIGMMMLTRWMRERNNGRGVVFATGTPITNTMAELYNILRFLQDEQLGERGISAFDSWRQTFAENSSDIEQTAAGDYKMVDRLAAFVNLPELQSISGMTFDTVWADQVGEIERPTRRDHIVEVPMSDAQSNYLQTIAARAEALKGGGVDPKEDNYLLLTTDAKKMSTDYRLVGGAAEAGELFSDTATKTKEATDKALEIWKAGTDSKPNVQLIFSDQGINPNEWGYTIYDEIIRLLQEGGVPEAKIVDFRKLTNKTKREKAIDRLFSGDALFGLGSSAKLGIGVNVQQHLKAIHHIDIDWRPDRKEQRDGRIWRDGNTHKEIDIFYYVTTGSFDTQMWQMNKRKAKFIREYMESKFNEREMVEDDGDVLGYADIMAVASGDPDLVTRVKLEDKAKKLALKERAFLAGKESVGEQIATTKRKIEGGRQITEVSQEAVDLYEQHKDDQFTIKIGDTTYYADEMKLEKIEDRPEGKIEEKVKKGDLSKRLMGAVRETGSYREEKIGEYRGWDLMAKRGDSGGFLSRMKHPENNAILIPFTAETDAGALASLEHHYKNIPDKMDRLQATQRQLEGELADLEARYAEESPHVTEIEESKTKLEAIKERMLARTSDQPPATEPEPGELGMPRRPLDPLDPEYDPHYTPKLMESPAGKHKTTTAPKVIAAAVKAAEALGVKAPVRVGVKGKKRAGFFKVHAEVVRIKRANDIETVIHELGHAIEKAVFGWVKGSPWVPPEQSPERMAELVRLGKALYGRKKPTGGYKREGWSEFHRLWETQPENAEKHAPEFFKWFEEEWLPNQPKKAQDALHAAQKEGVLYFQGQGALDRAKAAMVDPSTAKARLERAWKKAKEVASPEYTYEMLHPLHEIARAAEEKFGRDLESHEDPYVIAAALRKVHYGRVNEMVHHQMIDFAGNPVGAPLKDIKDLVKGKYDDFWAYMYAKRAWALWTDPNKPEGRNPGITLEDANQVISELETSEFMAASRKVYRWTDQTLDYAAEASPAFEAVVDKIREVDPGYYIPLQRIFDEMTKRYASGGRGSVAQRLKGSGRQIKDPLQQLIAQTSRLVRAAHQERIIEALIKLEGVEGMGQFIERIPVDKVPVAKLTMKDMIDRINKQLEWAGAGVAVEGQGYFDPSMLEQAITFFQPAKKAPNGKRVIVRYDPETKQPEWYEVNEDLYEMFETMEPYRLPAVGEWLAGKPTALKRAGTTGLKASFQLVWNMIRDPQTMFLQTQTKAWAPRLLLTWADSMKDAFLYRIAGRRTPALDAFIRMGGEMAQPLAQDINYTRRTARRMHEGRVVVVLDPRNWFDLFRDFIQFPELAPRIAELRILAREHGIDLNKPLTEKNSYFLALAAKEVTTDFTSEGKISRVMGRMVPFFNAQIQGPRATGRAYRRDPVKFMGRALQMAIFTVALWMLNKDEDWYIETPWRERFLHWQFETDWPEPTIIRLPRAFEIGMLFAALPEMMLDTWYRKDPEAAKAWAEVFIDVLTPGFIPVLAEEAYAQAKNEDIFWETPIVPQGELRLPPEEQFNEYTSKVSIKLGDWFNVSPRRIDHAIRGIGGTVPLDLLQVLGLGTKEMKREPTVSDLPIIGRAFRREGKMGTRSRSVDKVYDLHEEAVIKGSSKKNPETEEHRQRRLMLDDATDALSALSYTRRFTPESAKRQKLQALRVEIAREAITAAEQPVTEEVREHFKAKRKKAQTAELRSEVAGGRAGEPKNRSDAIRQALINDPDIDWKDLYEDLEDASFSRGRSWKDFQKRFYTIKGELEGNE